MIGQTPEFSPDPYYLDAKLKIQKQANECLECIVDKGHRKRLQKNLDNQWWTGGLFEKRGRVLSARNLYRYLEGKGGYDIYSFATLENSTVANNFNDINDRALDNIRGQLANFVESVIDEPGVYKETFQFADGTSQNFPFKSDFGTAFGSTGLVVNSVFQINISEGGNYNVSGSAYFTFRDTYRWHSNRKTVYGGLGIGSHQQLNSMKELGADDFYIRGYYEADLNLYQNFLGKYRFDVGQFKDSFNLSNHLGTSI